MDRSVTCPRSPLRVSNEVISHYALLTSLPGIEECLFKIRLPDHRELTFEVSYKKDDNKIFWAAEVDMLMKYEQFKNLDDQFWSNHATRNAILPTTDLNASPPLQPENVYWDTLKKYGAAIAVLKAAPKEDNYQYNQSAFNPFTLLRLGGKLSTQAVRISLNHMIKCVLTANSVTAKTGTCTT